MRTVVLRVVALALLLLLVLVAAISVRTLRRVPDTAVYFIASDGTSFHLEAVYRNGVRGDPGAHATAAVAALAAGPTPQEAARGLSSAVPADTRVLGADLNGGTLTVDLSPSFEQGGGSAMMMGRLNQLFYTLTRPKEVSSVVLEVGGRRVTVFAGEGITVPSPWRRADAPDRPVW
ncbi:MAG TPA: GerMN domain-containing protein [Trueperaceae bacterium]|nr:GerMN domain-containing protein [Trueperaceae bacterium]